MKTIIISNIFNSFVRPIHAVSGSMGLFSDNGGAFLRMLNKV